MIAGAALAAWLADRDEQDRSQARIKAFADKWRCHPLMTELEQRLEHLSERTPAAVVDAARAFMDRDDDIALIVADFIAASRADRYFRPPFVPASGANSGLLLFHNPDLSILLGASSLDMLLAGKTEPRGATSITFSGITTLFRFIKAGRATLSFWEAPPITDNFLASQAGTCRLVDRRRIEDGEEILIDGRHQSFVIEHAEADMLIFQAMVRPEAAPLAAEFDSRTLAFVGASSAAEASSRLQMMVSMLRVMDRKDALPVIIRALDNPHFFTRWHIMRELLALDAEAALPPLRRMAAKDPHPEVRAAARQTLDLFFPDEEDESAGAEDGAASGGMQCRA